ncbi:MAG: O-antigen ligase family protein [Acidimicrobiales bacterium]
MSDRQGLSAGFGSSAAPYPATGPSRSLLSGYTPVGLFGAAIAALLPIMVSPALDQTYWSLRDAFIPVIAGVGLTSLVALYAGPHRRVALMATAFGLWAVISALASPEPTVAFWGVYTVGTGCIFVVALIGCWAMGASVGSRGRGLVEKALLFAVLANTAMALLQVIIPHGLGILALFQGRSDGFMGNPVYLSQLLAGGWWLVGARFARRRLAWAGPALAVAAAIQVSGSRFALGLLVVAAVAGVFAFGRRAGLTLAALALVGLLAGSALAHLNGAVTSSARAGTDASSGIKPRVESWWSARHAVANRPLLGEGPGTYLAATTPYHPLGMAQTEGPDRLFADAHDIVVEYTVTTGIPGIILLVAWFVLMVRRTRWRQPLAGFALLVLAMHLAEPQMVATTPLAFLALGAAMALREPPKPVVKAPVRAILGAGAVATGVFLIVGSVQLKQAQLSENPAQARAAIRDLPAWYQPREQLASDYLFLADTHNDPSYRVRAEREYLRAIAVDPAEPNLWVALAGIESKAGHLRQAARYDRQALVKNPWSLLGLQALATIEAKLGHNPAHQALEAKLRLLPATSGGPASVLSSPSSPASAGS